MKCPQLEYYWCTEEQLNYNWIKIFLFSVSVPSLKSKMTDRTPWWKAFLPKWKTGGSKDAGAPNTFGPDFDPFAPQPEKQKDPAAAASRTTDDQSLSQQESNNSSSLFSDDTYDDSYRNSVFNEQTCRRNMKVSRSGRFKEKRRVRSSLPIQERETENVASGKEDIRWWGTGGGDQRLLYEDAWREGKGFEYTKMLQTLETYQEVYCTLVKMVMKMTRSI